MGNRQGHGRSQQRVRRRVRVRAFGDDGFEVTGHTRDISSTGAMIETGRLPELDQRLHLEFALPTGPFFCEGTVSRIKRTPPQLRSVKRQAFAVRFLAPDWMVRSFGDDEIEDVAVADEVPEHIPIGVSLTDPKELEDVYFEDIVHGGLRVRTTEKVQLDEDVSVPVELPPPHGTIDCQGTVVALFDGGFALRLAEIEPVRLRIAEILGKK